MMEVYARCLLMTSFTHGRAEDVGIKIVQVLNVERAQVTRRKNEERKYRDGS